MQKFNSNGNFILGWGSVGSGPGQFNRPWSVAVDGSGNVYVGDNDNNRVQKFDSSGGYITQWGTPGSGDGQFSGPGGIAVDASNNVYVSDRGNSRVQKFSQVSVGPVSEWAGEGTADDSADGNDGALQGGAGFAAGRVGQAFSFGGSGDYVSVPSAANLNPTGSFTLSAWVYPTQDAYQPFIVKWGDLGAWANQRAYMLSMAAGRNLNFSISDVANQGNGGFQHLSSPGGVVTLNAWNHVAGVYGVCNLSCVNGHSPPL